MHEYAKPLGTTSTLRKSMPYKTFFELFGVESVEPNFDFSEFDINNPHRPLTSPEIRQYTMQQNIVCIGFLDDEKTDLGRLTECVNYIMQIYPFLSGGIEYDPKINWMRYRPPRDGVIKTFDLEKQLLGPDGQPLPPVTSGAKLLSAFNGTTDFMDNDNLCEWKLVAVRRPEVVTPDDEFLMAEFRYALVLTVPHALGDGSSFYSLYKKINEVYESGKPITPENFDFTPRQQTCFRASLAMPMEYLKQLEPLEARRALPNIAVAKVHNPSPINHNFMKGFPRRTTIVDPKQFFREPGHLTALCMSAVSLAINAAYGYMHKDYDIESDEPVPMASLDIRRAYDFFAKGRIPGLKLGEEHIGQGTVAAMCHVKVTPKSTILDLIEQVTKAYQAIIERPDDVRWKMYGTVDVMPARRKVESMGATAVISNVALVDLGPSHPICCMVGAAGSDNPGAQLMIATYTLSSSKKYGCYLFGGRSDAYYPLAYMDAFRTSWLRIQREARAEGTYAHMDIHRVCAILREELVANGAEKMPEEYAEEQARAAEQAKNSTA